MEPELQARLNSTSKQQIVQLLEELLQRHPELLTEMAALLNGIAEKEDKDLRLDDWDEGNIEELVILPSSRHPVAPPMDLEAYRQRVERYSERLRQRESATVITTDLEELLFEAEQRTLQYDYYNALGIYAIVLDERLKERNATLIRLLDHSMDEVIPDLATLLSEASSSLGYDSNVAPLLSKEERQHWLTRLVTLWLKRLDNREIEEDLSEILLDMIWQEDIPILVEMVTNELQRLRKGKSSTIVDLNQKYRLRVLERFLKELPYTKQE
jgi:hypothetical protein